jgi:prolyl oligopeptidase
VFGGNILVHSIRDVHSVLTIYSIDGDLIANVTLPGLGQVSNFVGTAQSRTSYFTFQSFARPKEVFALDMKTGATHSYFRPKMPLEPTTISVQQGFATSADGTRVPLFVVHKCNLKPSNSAPTILEGYGGFGYSLLPRFNRTVVTWAETGGVYAIANLRGGGEYGERWHRAGKLGKKQNVFDDFYAAARWLVENGYASHETLGAWGGSNGGLLMGAAITQQPRLFKSVVSVAPLLDMVRFPRFGVGGVWVTEYGDPSREEDFEWLRAYSPYHNVKSNVTYPSTLLYVFKNDDRVDPMHARKFAAALQHGQVESDRPILMRVQARVGHAGGDARAVRLTRAVDELTFFYATLSN